MLLIINNFKKKIKVTLKNMRQYNVINTAVVIHINYGLKGIDFLNLKIMGWYSYK